MNGGVHHISTSFLKRTYLIFYCLINHCFSTSEHHLCPLAQPQIWLWVWASVQWLAQVALHTMIHSQQKGVAFLRLSLSEFQWWKYLIIDVKNWCGCGGHPRVYSEWFQIFCSKDTRWCLASCRGWAVCWCFVSVCIWPHTHTVTHTHTHIHRTLKRSPGSWALRKSSRRFPSWFGKKSETERGPECLCRINTQGR